MAECFTNYKEKMMRMRGLTILLLGLMVRSAASATVRRAGRFLFELTLTRPKEMSMNAMRSLLLILSALLLFENGWSTVRRVPGDFATLNQAYTAAVNGDTILLGAQVYSENLSSSKRLTIIGTGMSLTTIAGQITLNQLASGSVLEGLKVSTTSAEQIVLATGVDSITIRRCQIIEISNNGYRCIRQLGTGGRLYCDDSILSYRYTGGSSGPGSAAVWVDGGGSFIFRNCIFAGQNPTDVKAFSGPAVSLIMTNCVFIGLGSAVSVSGGLMTFSNNIAYDWNGTGSWGTYPPASTIEYNAAPSVPGSIGTNFVSLTANPFINYNTANNYVYGTSDMHVNATAGGGLLCVDAGVPAILDLDGTRSDLGIYGGQLQFIDSGAPNYPFVSSLTVPTAVTVGQPLQIQATGRIGRGY